MWPIIDSNNFEAWFFRVELGCGRGRELGGWSSNKAPVGPGPNPDPPAQSPAPALRVWPTTTIGSWKFALASRPPAGPGYSSVCNCGQGELTLASQISSSSGSSCGMDLGLGINTLKSALFGPWFIPQRWVVQEDAKQFLFPRSSTFE